MVTVEIHCLVFQNPRCWNTVAKAEVWTRERVFPECFGGAYEVLVRRRDPNEPSAKSFSLPCVSRGL